MDFGAVDPGLARALLGEAPQARAVPARAPAFPDPRPVAALVCGLAAVAILAAAWPLLEEIGQKIGSIAG